MTAAKSKERPVYFIVLLSILSAVFVSVFSQGYVLAWTCTAREGECALYEAAITDAKENMVVTRAWPTLTSIDRKNPNLIWKDGVVGSKVLVASYRRGTSEKPPYVDCEPGVPFPKDCPLTGSLWVTVVPELFAFFNTHAFFTLRLEQLLGLPPGYGNNYIVEYWVDPKDLFRPALDPAITYSDGRGRFFRDGGGMPVPNSENGIKAWDDYCTWAKTGCGCCDPVQCRDQKCVCEPGSRYKDYKCWFQNRKEWIYSYDLSSPPYPWTGLGYTYDWGNSETSVGLSEFVLNKQPGGEPFSVTVHSVTMAPLYCARGQQTTLTITKTGFGKGSVATGESPDLSCGPYCATDSAKVGKYTRVRLTATPTRRSRFVGWGGACSGTSPICTITMLSDQSVTAHFGQKP